jgi:hypothetical protein
MDARPTKTLAVIDGRDVPSEGNVGAVVQSGIESYLRRAGARVVLLDAPFIEGEVLEWRSTVMPGFPSSSASAVARISVVVKGKDSRQLYRGTFKGDSSATNPVLKAKHVNDLLAQAMGSAIEAFVQRPELQQILEQAQR